MEAEAPKMVYRPLGNTGLKVSILSLGTWILSYNEESEANLIECMKKAWELGVNSFDTAVFYGDGAAERVLGRALKAIGAEREDFVITTKLYRSGTGINDCALSRKHLTEGMKSSYKKAKKIIES